MSALLLIEAATGRAVNRILPPEEGSGWAPLPGFQTIPDDGRPLWAEPPPPMRIIRSLAFRERLAEPQRQALTAAAVAAVPLDGGALLTFLLDQAASTVTDLDDPKVQAGVQGMVAAGLITAQDAQLLLADGRPDEAPPA